jgi:hypothetical protein
MYTTFLSRNTCNIALLGVSSEIDSILYRQCRVSISHSYISQAKHTNIFSFKHGYAKMGTLRTFSIDIVGKVAHLAT